jgi:hypothetical protein
MKSHKDVAEWSMSIEGPKELSGFKGSQWTNQELQLV